MSSSSASSDSDHDPSGSYQAPGGRRLAGGGGRSGGGNSATGSDQRRGPSRGTRSQTGNERAGFLSLTLDWVQDMWLKFGRAGNRGTEAVITSDLPGVKKRKRKTLKHGRSSKRLRTIEDL